MSKHEQAAILLLADRLADWGEYDEGVINDRREEAAATLRALSAQLTADLDAAVLAERERCGAIAESHNYGFQSTTDADLRASHIATEIRKGCT
jgi:hypothetical protein